MMTFTSATDRPFRRIGIVTLLLSALLAMASLSGCERDFSPIVPEFDASESKLKGARTITDDEIGVMEGVYTVEEGSAMFGQEVVLRWSDRSPSIFCRTNGAFFILIGGAKNDSVIFEGYWRNAYNLQTGKARLTIAPDDGGRDIVKGKPVAAPIIMRGVIGHEGAAASTPVTLRFNRPLPVDTLKDFFILGHRGGGRNSDFHPFSENSLEMLRFAHRLGCNGVEIDIQLTADDVPILFHDLNFSTRLVKGDHMVGPVVNYTYQQINRFTTLVNGERVPTLEEALKTIDQETSIRFVWVDVKTAETIPKVVPIIRKALKDAENRKVPLEIVIGLWTQQTYDAYTALPPEDRLPALSELSTDLTSAIDADVWAPRWTLGLQTDEVARMHAEGRRAFVWTLDQEFAIEDFLYDGDYDGILTNYPTVVAWYYYTRGGA